MLHNMLESIELLADGIRSFDERCARGIEPDRERIRRNWSSSLMLVTALNPHIGYEKRGEDRAEGASRGHDAARGCAGARLVTAEDFDRWVDPAAMTKPD